MLISALARRLPHKSSQTLIQMMNARYGGGRSRALPRAMRCLEASKPVKTDEDMGGVNYESLDKLDGPMGRQAQNT